MCSERCHCLISLSWAFYQQAQKQKFQDIFMYKYQPSSCPHRPKSERVKPLLTTYQPLLTPQMFTAIFCAVSFQSIQPALVLVPSSIQPMQQLLSVAVHCCRCLTDRQTELPRWTGRVSEVMQSFLTSQNLKPAVHTHHCTSLLSRAEHTHGFQSH